MDASMDAPFAYSRGPPVQYAMQRFDGAATFTRGVLVLRWASEQIRADRDLVRFLVWANPSNLCFASAALQADHDIVATALQSPYYWEEQPKTSSALVLLNAAESLREERQLVLDAVALNGHELEFAGDRLRADPYVVAWAGAPRGAGASMLCGRELVRFMNKLPQSGISVAHVEANQKEVLEGFAKHVPSFGGFGDSRKLDMLEMWRNFRPDQKAEWCKSMCVAIQGKVPLFFRVAPAVRDVLWPTLEAWDGAF
jgi:hypothetical protein